MASTISAQEVPPSNGQLFYCHQCTHQWRKSQNSDFSCPQCQQGFIEEVSDANNLPVERESNSDPLFSIIHRIMSDISPPITRRSRAQTASSRASRSTRSRSRSPRMTFFVGSIDRRDGESGAGSSTTTRRLDRGLSSRAFHFDLDDLMSSFLSSPRPPPVSQTRLSEIPQITITQEQTDSNTQCSVCFDEFRLAESDVRKLPCNHLFHEKCIFPWLRINGTCPVCRAPLQQGGDDGEAATDNVAANSAASSFDNILRYMRQRRTARRGTISQPTTSRSAQTGSTAAPDSPAVPSRRHRVSLSSRLGLQTGSSSNIEMALARLRSTHSHPVVRIPRLPESLQSASRRVAAANVAANESIIDLTSSSDTEASNNSRIIPRSSSSSSSSSSSASSSSSNSALSMPIPMDTSDSDDSDNLLVETFPESPSDDEE